MKLTIALLLIMASNICLSKTCSELDSRTAAHDFYTKVQENKLFSVPTEEQLKKIKPYITAQLYNLLSAAATAEKNEFKHTQGKQPPLFEGHLFSGMTEGYTNFFISSGVPGISGTEIYVFLQFAQHLMPYYAATPGILEWKERVEIKAEGEKCLVNNIFFSLENNSESLVSVLSNIITP